MSPEHPPRHRPHSELEMAALGYLWNYGPCTAYRVRRGFQESPSSHWSGSAGAIYPLLQRLEEQGLLQSSAEARGERSRRLLAVTPRGEELLRRWLQAGIDLETASAIFDAVRSRSFFLGLLLPEDRLRFVRSALRSSEKHAELVQSDLEKRAKLGDRFGALGARGAWHAARARLTWLRELEEDLAADLD